MRIALGILILCAAGCGAGGGGDGGSAGPVAPPPAGSASITLPGGGALATTTGTVAVDATISGAASIAWTVIDGPATPLLTGAATEDPTVQVPLAGSYRVRVRATDNAGAVTEAVLTITASGGWTLAGNVSDDGAGRSGLGVAVTWAPTDNTVLTITTTSAGDFSRAGLMGAPDQFRVTVPGG